MNTYVSHTAVANPVTFNKMKKVAKCISDSIEEPPFEELLSIESELTNDNTDSDVSYDVDETSKAWRKNFEDNSIRYCDEASKFHQLSDEETIALAMAKDNGDINARNKLMEGNLLLVVKLARKYAHSLRLDENDLIQDGNLGLMRAADKYDYTKGFRFSTYATWWIRQSILRGIADTSRTIRLPVHQNERLNRLFRIEVNFTTENGRAPTLKELSELSGIPLKELSELKNISTPVYFSAPVSEEDDSSELGEFIPSTDNSVSDQAENNILTESLVPALRTFLKTEREVLILTKRFGLDGNKALSLEAVAEELGITRERVRQIEEKAIQHLKHTPSFSRMFKDFN